MTAFQAHPTREIRPGTFEPADHWYPRALNAQIHPMVSFFMNLGPERLLTRYCHLNPRVDRQKLAELLDYRPRYFLHAGADLFHVTNAQGNRQMVVIETNSSPSGQKSMPLVDEQAEQGGYRTYMAETFLPAVKARRNKVEGRLAVIYDKNPMEASGYAGAMADVFGEPVLFAPFFLQDPDPPVRFRDSVMEVRDAAGTWHPIRAAFRYVTQKPWNRLPVFSRTLILNPVIACLAGGRNKTMAAKAYDLLNAEIAPYGLHIHTPATIWDVHKNEIPLWVRKLGGHAVIKVPYSNAGQGVYTIVNEGELDAFMGEKHAYDKFIVQSLIGNYKWSSTSEKGRLYHVGTMPSTKKNSYVADLRMMITRTEKGIRPVAIYARRAREPLMDDLHEAKSSWDILGTNLSIKREDGTFGSDSSRLMMMDRRDFNKLGISVDDLIEGYIQTLLAMVAIDQMAQTLLNQKGRLRPRLFRSLNEDPVLIQEIMSE
ncbi:MAG: hypothetical protein D6722_23600 [Bacteroidetes bacterium]|nr:MAG: hypothetical protein D6722_23600 [Bacteroidota bacterium]